MGAFFLFQNDSQFNKPSARAVFEKKGFAPPKEFALGPMRLWLYRKQLVCEDNFFTDASGASVFATGTVIYKGHNYRQTLATLLNDFLQQRIDFEQLTGSFCAIFYANDKVVILTDWLNSHHLFLNEGHTRISSSFLAMLASHTHPLALNRLALYEKLATGYIVGPDTLVSGIQQLTDDLIEKSRDRCFSFVRHPPRVIRLASDRNGFDACVDHQLAVLKCYFQAISPLAAEYSPELGLSNGYDSRLVLALGQALPTTISLHTHCTAGCRGHESNLDSVRALAAVHGNPLRVVKTTPMERKSEDDLSDVLMDGLYYFDGRCSHNMGAFSETYTRAYRLKVLGESRLTLNGLGGEIYRNYYLCSRERFGFRSWMEHHAYYAGVASVLPGGRKELHNDLHPYIIRKMMRVLDADLTGRIDQLTMQRYYSEVRMPDCDAVNNNAHNQLVFFLTPFIEYRTNREGYKARPLVGISGAFQTAMLAKIDRPLAGIMSHYGFPLTHESLRYKSYAMMKGYIPDWLSNARDRFKTRFFNLGEGNVRGYVSLRQRSPVIREIESSLKTYLPHLDAAACVRDPAQQRTLLFVGSLLREFGQYITAS